MLTPRFTTAPTSQELCTLQTLATTTHGNALYILAFYSLDHHTFIIVLNFPVMKGFWCDQTRLLLSLHINHHKQDLDKLKTVELLLLKSPGALSVA